jgi:5'(3')-deoxyribonucleotidase
MKHNRHIAVDLDDVVLDFWKGVCAAVELEYGIKVDPAQTRDWDNNQVKTMNVFGKGRTWWDWLKERDWIWQTFGVVPGALGGLHQLRQAGYWLECVTSKPEWAEWTTWKWLGKWRPPFNSVTIVNSTQRKVDMTDAHIIIDDKPQNCEEFQDAGRRSITFKQPWNMGMMEWPEIVKTLLEEINDDGY